MALDASERKIALRHIKDAGFQASIAERADEVGNGPLAADADARAVEALEAAAVAYGYRLVPLSVRGALADSVKARVSSNTIVGGNA
jgi:hypothetical protein